MVWRPAWLSVIGRRHPTHSFSPLGRREKSGVYILQVNFFGEGGDAQRTGFCLNWLWECEPAYCRCLEATENNGEQSGLQRQHLRSWSTESGRDYGLLKKKLANLWLEITHGSYITQKRFHRPPNLQLGWLVKVFSYVKPVHKDWEIWLFFQMHKFSKQITRHMKKQRNIAQSNEQINLQKQTPNKQKSTNFFTKNSK